MADKKLKMTLDEAFILIWETCVGYEKDNFTPEYQAAVMNAVARIREVA